MPTGMSNNCGRECIDPSIGSKLQAYNQDAVLPPDEKILSPQDKLSIETHLIRCAFCRNGLNQEARAALETTLIWVGFFIEDPSLREQRMAKFKRLLSGQLTVQDSEEMSRGVWLEISEQERQHLHRFFGRNG